MDHTIAFNYHEGDFWPLGDCHSVIPTLASFLSGAFPDSYLETCDMSLSGLSDDQARVLTRLGLCLKALGPLHFITGLRVVPRARDHPRPVMVFHSAAMAVASVAEGCHVCGDSLYLVDDSLTSLFLGLRTIGARVGKLSLEDGRYSASLPVYFTVRGGVKRRSYVLRVDTLPADPRAYQASCMAALGDLEKPTYFDWWTTPGVGFIHFKSKKAADLFVEHTRVLFEEAGLGTTVLGTIVTKTDASFPTRPPRTPLPSGAATSGGWQTTTSATRGALPPGAISPVVRKGTPVISPTPAPSVAGPAGAAVAPAAGPLPPGKAGANKRRASPATPSPLVAAGAVGQSATSTTSPPMGADASKKQRRMPPREFGVLITGVPTDVPWEEFLSLYGHPVAHSPFPGNDGYYAIFPRREQVTRLAEEPLRGDPVLGTLESICLVTPSVVPSDSLTTVPRTVPVLASPRLVCEPVEGDYFPHYRVINLVTQSYTEARALTTPDRRRVEFTFASVADASAFAADYCPTGRGVLRVGGTKVLFSFDLPLPPMRIVQFPGLDVLPFSALFPRGRGILPFGFLQGGWTPPELRLRSTVSEYPWRVVRDLTSLDLAEEVVESTTFYVAPGDLRGFLDLCAGSRVPIQASTDPLRGGPPPPQCPEAEDVGKEYIPMHVSRIPAAASGGRFGLLAPNLAWTHALGISFISPVAPHPGNYTHPALDLLSLGGQQAASMVRWLNAVHGAFASGGLHRVPGNEVASFLYSLEEAAFVNLVLCDDDNGDLIFEVSEVSITIPPLVACVAIKAALWLATPAGGDSLRLSGGPISAALTALLLQPLGWRVCPRADWGIGGPLLLCRPFLPYLSLEEVLSILTPESVSAPVITIGAVKELAPLLFPVGRDVALASYTGPGGDNFPDIRARMSDVRLDGYRVRSALPVAPPPSPNPVALAARPLHPESSSVVSIPVQPGVTPPLSSGPALECAGVGTTELAAVRRLSNKEATSLISSLARPLVLGLLLCGVVHDSCPVPTEALSSLPLAVLRALRGLVTEGRWSLSPGLTIGLAPPRASRPIRPCVGDYLVRDEALLRVSKVSGSHIYLACRAGTFPHKGWSNLTCTPRSVGLMWILSVAPRLPTGWLRARRLSLGSPRASAAPGRD